MKNRTVDCQLAVIGGGPAGLAAALAAEREGQKGIVIFERDRELGGILQQCIHNGFGLGYFKEELTGPEYAERFIEKLENSNIKVKTGTMVLNLSRDKELTVLSRENGLEKIKAKAVILAMGCRERTREAICIKGDRPAGIFSAGTAQRYINMEGYMPGKEVVILGSGDIGLIMARRMTLEGAKVKAVLELMPYSTGLVRNRVQCLDDFDIPLLLSHTITCIHGDKRVEKVTISQVDENLKPISGTQRDIDCDTLLLSVGLIPENELSEGAGIEIDSTTAGPLVSERRETLLPGVFACGNVLHVHDLVDNVTLEAEIAGQAAARYLQDKLEYAQDTIKVKTGENIRYVLPQQISGQDLWMEKLEFSMRVKEPDEKVRVVVSNDRGEKLASYPLRVVTPAEMITVSMPTDKIKDTCKNLLFSVESKG